MKRWLARLIPLLTLCILCAVTAQAANTHGSVQNQRYDGYTIRQGIDVSEHNGTIDWKTVAASGQADFAFIRVGYRGYSSGGLYPDSRYRENITGALAAGLDIGVYIYSQAITEAEAVEEARYVLELLGEYSSRVTLPIVIDFEYAESNGYVGRLYDAHLSAEAATAICNAFCDTIRSAGFDACVYANPVMLDGRLHAQALRGDLWLANYVDETSYEGPYTFWQYTSSGGVYGVTGAVDRNYWYVSPPDDDAIRAEAIWVEQTSFTLQAGEQVQIQAEIEPLDSVDTLRFYSEDPTIAYVDKLTGELTAFREGQTRIFVSTANGLSELCEVTVQGSRAESYALRITAAPDTLYTGAGTQTDLVVHSDSLVGATAQVAIDYLNLRIWPNTDYAAVTVLTRGEVVTVLDSTVIDEMQWLAVRTHTEGLLGYVAAEYLDHIQGGTVLTEGEDYLVSYTGNDQPGTATVTVEGIGRYQGSDSATFTVYSFSDVQPGDWYYDAVLQTVRGGTMRGTSTTTFSPNEATSRAMLVTILHRMSGSPAATGGSFADVQATDWFADAVVWASETQLDTGLAVDAFEPNEMLTRVQLAVMLYRYTAWLGYATPTVDGAGESFADWAAYDWLSLPQDTQHRQDAQEAVRWAVSTGLLQGMDNNELSLLSGATRAQICTVLVRYQALLQQLQDGGVPTEAPVLAGDG